ncbi:MAG: FAD-dependent oxidoreductase [Myxococcota bacterium]
MSHNISYIDATQYEAEVLDSKQPVVVDFYSTECPPCEALAQKYEALATLYGNDIKFVKIFRQENRALADKLNVRSSPTVLFYRDGKLVGEQLTGGIKRAAIEKNLAELIPAERFAALRAQTPLTEREVDVLILGAGPAGLTAGIYTAQAKLRTVIVDRALAGGNLAITHRVSNYPGFPEPQPGYQLAHQMAEHARKAGVELREAVDLTAIDLSRLRVTLDGVESISAKKIIVATGSSPRPLGVRGELEYKGKGVSYCATCDAKYFEGKHAVVIGGGNSAIGESLLIAKFASKVTIVHQFDVLQATRELVEIARLQPNIEIVLSHEPREFVAHNGTVDAVLLENMKTHERHTLACDGVFVFAGMQPNLDGVAEAFTRDEYGYIAADDEMRTNRPHVFAAGDVRNKKYRQMTTAVADGTIAAMAISRDLSPKLAA